MGEVSTIGVDIAKSVFQIHGVDAEGAVVIRKRVGRARVLEFFADLPPCRAGWKRAQQRTSGLASSRS
jgi:transposase